MKRIVCSQCAPISRGFVGSCKHFLELQEALKALMSEAEAADSEWVEEAKVEIPDFREAWERAESLVRD